MSTIPHKAGWDQWHNLYQYLKLDRVPDHISITLELAARVEALEAAQREAAMDEPRPTSAEARPATGEPTDRELRELFWYRPKGPETEAAALRRVFQAGMAAAVQSSAQQEIADAEAPGLTSTSGSLVDQVAILLAKPGNCTWDGMAVDVIRAVAAWMRDRNWRWVAQMLELEADR